MNAAGEGAATASVTMIVAPTRNNLLRISTLRSGQQLAGLDGLQSEENAPPPRVLSWAF